MIWRGILPLLREFVTVLSVYPRTEGLTMPTDLIGKDIFAFCYTQLTDVEQEQNGVLTYEREFKFPAEKYARIFGKKAVIED